jgi:shikimate dehydrogenase
LIAENEVGPGATPTASTAVCGVVGDPVSHSISPIVHNAAFRNLGLNYVYVAFPVPTTHGNSVVSAMRTLGLKGLSVTMPHKDLIAQFADEASDDVIALGSGNTLRWVDGIVGGRVRAETTDGAGCVAALREEAADPSGLRVMVIGAGGAGRAVIQALARASAREIVIVNRNKVRAHAATGLANGLARVGSIDEVDSCDIIINATSVGMGSKNDGDSAEMPLDPNRLGPGQIVNDLVYHPLTTPLLQAALERGAKPIAGTGMLLHQAVLQFQFWTGLDAPIECMREAVKHEISLRNG